MSNDQTRFLNSVKNIIDDALILYREPRSITIYNDIPETTKIPIENKNLWFQIPDVICVYVDMIGSTKLNIEKYAKTCAKVFHLFVDTITKIFHDFEAPYIDIQGDGVFALFNQNQPYRALAAAVTVKTFIENDFSVAVKSIGGVGGARMGIDQGTVLVRKIGLKFHERTDRQNELWAGKTVNMAVKLASESEKEELLVSDRYYSKITDDLVRKSCGCNNGEYDGNKVDLWTKKDVKSVDKFDFDYAYLLKTHWCPMHGKEFCTNILKLDE